ncbi:MAG: dihydroorotase [Azospirillaceae bacterium]
MTAARPAPGPGARRTAYVGARLIDPDSSLDAPGGLLVEAGRIAALGPGVAPGGDALPDDAAIVDCGGAVLAPGLVDMRVRVGAPGEEHKETIASAADAAAAGGVTAMACLPDTDPPIDNEAALALVARQARAEKRVKVYAQACLTKGSAGADLAEIGLLARAGAVAFTDGRRATADAQVMLRALAYASAHGALVIQHPEEPSLAAGGQMNAGEIATRLGLSGIPREAEVMMVERDLRLVAKTGARYHAAHVSTPEALDVIAAAKARGLPVTCETAPPYFTLTEVDVGDYRTFAKLSPPLRTDADRAAVAAAVADGTIDVIASDHCPQDQDSKRLPFALAEPGAVGLETLLPLALELYHQERVTLPDLLARLTLRPARLLGLDAGRLAVGAPADLVVFDPDRPWVIDADRLVGKSKNTPYDRRPVMGRVLATVVDGRPVHDTLSTAG